MWIREICSIDGVHGLEAIEVSHENADAHGVFKRASGNGKDAADTIKGHPCFAFDIAGRRNKRWIISSKLASDKDKVARASRLTIRNPFVALFGEIKILHHSPWGVVACTWIVAGKHGGWHALC